MRVLKDQHLEDARLIWDYHRLDHEPRPCSAAIGLGTYDIGVAQVAAALYHRGMFPVIVFSGRHGLFSEGRLDSTEAEWFRDEALRLGVPAEAMLVEPEATNTGENITFSRRLLADAGVTVESIMLVCTPYMERRAYATCRKVWPEVDVVCASAAVSFDDYLNLHGDEFPVIDMIVGDLQRIIAYPARGFAVAQDVPAEVLDAYQRLLTAGYQRRPIPD